MGICKEREKYYTVTQEEVMLLGKNCVMMGNKEAPLEMGGCELNGTCHEDVEKREHLYVVDKNVLRVFTTQVEF